MTENMGTTLLSDTKEIIHTFDSFTNKDQKSCAVFIWTEIVKSLNKIEGKEPGDELNEIMKEQINRATHLRHLALENGGFDSNGNFWSDEMNPEWAKAATLEGFLQANTGMLGETGETITSLILVWVGSVLTEDEMNKIQTEIDSRTLHNETYESKGRKSSTNGIKNKIKTSWPSLLSLIYPLGDIAFVWNAPLTLLEKLGHVIGFLGYLFIAAWIFSGTFLIFGLKKRGHVLIAAVICVLIAGIFSNFNTLF
jgi:hypothetical protein